MVRWQLDEVIQTLNIPQPEGLIELWDALPEGATTTTTALQAARRQAQTGIAQGIALIEQKVAAAAGSSVGFRPELFDRVRNLPGVDVLTETALALIAGNFDMATLTNAARELLTEIIAKVGQSTGVALIEPDYLGGVAAVVQIVWWAVDTIVTAEKRWAEYEKALADANLECLPPAYSAKFDRAQVDAAIAILAGPDWRDLMLPEVRPFDPDYTGKEWGPDAGLPEAGWLDDGWRGFTCCRTPNGGRVISPVGNGVGNRVQSSFLPIYYGHSGGFGMLPMCPDLPIHRAIVTPPGGQPPYETAQVLAQLAGVGKHVWRLLWNGGPAAFAVPPGKFFASAWTEYLSAMRHFIARNEYGIGGDALYDRRVCDNWDAKGRRRPLEFLFTRLGMPADAAASEGIVTWNDSTPVQAWNAFDAFAHGLLKTLGIVWTNAKTCAPEWREKVHAAQRAIVNHSTAPCEYPLASLEQIPDQELRAALLEARKSRPPVCHASATNKLQAYTKVGPTEGLSLAPIGNAKPSLPPFPAEPAEPTEPAGPRSPRRRPPTLGEQTPAKSPEAPAGGGAGALLLLALLVVLGYGLTKR